MSAGRRFRISRSSWYRPLLAAFGGTESRSYVEVQPDRLVTRFGWHTISVPRASIRSAERSPWPWYGGIGWRTNFRATLGLIGSYDGVVRLQLDPPVRARLLGIPLRVRDLYISVEDPAGFLAAISGSRRG